MGSTRLRPGPGCHLSRPGSTGMSRAGRNPCSLIPMKGSRPRRSRSTWASTRQSSASAMATFSIRSSAVAISLSWAWSSGWARTVTISSALGKSQTKYIVRTRYANHCIWPVAAPGLPDAPSAVAARTPFVLGGLALPPVRAFDAAAGCGLEAESAPWGVGGTPSPRHSVMSLRSLRLLACRGRQGLAVGVVR